MKLDWWPVLVPASLSVCGLFLFWHITNTRPLDDHLVYQALQRQLRKPQMAGDHLLDLSPAKMIERNGEAILVGKGSTRYSASDDVNIPVLEHLNFEYIMVISRECHDLDAKCYAAQQVEFTGEKSSLPLI